jgi:hypothetical protein
LPWSCAAKRRQRRITKKRRAKPLPRSVAPASRPRQASSLDKNPSAALQKADAAR